MRQRRTLIYLLLILAIAGFFRFWQLDSIPPGLYPDEAMNGNNALDSLKSGDFKIFYPDNNGREGLFIWLISFSFWLFGPSILSMKIVSALFGTLTVLGIYLLTKELFLQYSENSSRNIALLTSFFLAVSFWHINFSRISFRAIMIPFILSFGFYLLFKGFRTKKILLFIISGVIFGLGFYTYISYRFIVVLGALTLILWWLVYKRQKKQKQFFILSGCLLIAMFISALPIGIYFFQNPQDFFGRANDVSIFNYENPLLEFGKSVILHLGMFNFYGDANWRHNYSGSPQLHWIVGIFFLAGVILSTKNFFKNDNFIPGPNLPGWQIGAKFIAPWFLVSWLIIMLSANFLSAEGNPHALRAIGAIPAAYILSAVGAYWFSEKIKRFYRTKKETKVFYFLIFILLASIAFNSFDKYFIQWADKDEVKNAFSKNFVEIGNYLNSLPNDIKKYVIVNQSGVTVNGIPVPSQTTMFIERTVYGRPRAEYILPEDIEKIKIEKNMILITLQPEEDLFLKISQQIPGGSIEEINNKFKIYKYAF